MANQRLTDLLDYWSTWNAAKHAGIVERAGDQAAREIAQLAEAQIEQLRAALEDIADQKNLVLHIDLPTSLSRRARWALDGKPNCTASLGTDEPAAERK